MADGQVAARFLFELIYRRGVAWTARTVPIPGVGRFFHRHRSRFAEPIPFLECVSVTLLVGA